MSTLAEFIDNTHGPEPAPEYDAAAHFDAIWRGDASGFSEADRTERLAEYRRLLDDLNAGRTTPAKIVGSGVKKPKTTARAWLQQQIAEAERDLESRGRTNGVNISNVAYAAPGGHVRKDHRIQYVNSDEYRHLWQAVCSCGEFRTTGYTAAVSLVVRDADRHLAAVATG